MKKIEDLDVSGKKVFLRADLDVDSISIPFDDLKTNSRLLALKPTVDWLLENKVKQVIIAGHIGRPEKIDPELSTKNLIPVLEEILAHEIAFTDQFPISGGQFPKDKIVLFENLRFWKGEKANEPDFAQKLANIADLYVNEAFGNCHRAHASMVGITSFLPSAAGIHLQKEVSELSKLLVSPKKPFVAVIGGAKIETKVPVIENLAKIADRVLVGGKIALEIMETKDDHLDVKDNKKVIIAGVLEHCFDINNEAISKFKSVLSSAKTVVWNGPLGFFEKGYKKGSLEVANAIVDSGAYSVVGGGETTEFLEKEGLISKFSFVSSGGGAMLEFLSGKELPAIAALE